MRKRNTILFILIHFLFLTDCKGTNKLVSYRYNYRVVINEDSKLAQNLWKFEVEKDIVFLSFKGEIPYVYRSECRFDENKKFNIVSVTQCRYVQFSALIDNFVVPSDFFSFNFENFNKEMTKMVKLSFEPIENEESEPEIEVNHFDENGEYYVLNFKAPKSSFITEELFMRDETSLWIDSVKGFFLVLVFLAFKVRSFPGSLFFGTFGIQMILEIVIQSTLWDKSGFFKNGLVLFLPFILSVFFHLIRMKGVTNLLSIICLFTFHFLYVTAHQSISCAFTEVLGTIVLLLVIRNERLTDSVLFAILSFVLMRRKMTNREYGVNNLAYFDVRNLYRICWTRVYTKYETDDFFDSKYGSSSALILLGLILSRYLFRLLVEKLEGKEQDKKEGKVNVEREEQVGLKDMELPKAIFNQKEGRR